MFLKKALHFMFGTVFCKSPSVNQAIGCSIPQNCEKPSVNIQFKQISVLKISHLRSGRKIYLYKMRQTFEYGKRKILAVSWKI